MRVEFTTEIQNEKKEYIKMSDTGTIIHFYENSSCLIQADADNMLYRVELKKLKPIEKKGIFK